MATANTVELETCMAECLAWCSANEDLEFVQFHLPRLSDADKTYRESIATSDAKFIAWRHEERDGAMAWKLLANELRGVQRQLKRVNAIGFPDRKLLYWDHDELLAEVARMMGYLTERTTAIPDGVLLIEGLERASAKAATESREDAAAYREYTRHAALRSDAFGSIERALSDFRGSMRRQLGKRDERYRGIRWPMSLNPDVSVL